MARKASAPIPVGRWVKATKVKVNRDGTVNAMVPGSSLKKRNPAKKKAKRKAATKKVAKKKTKKRK